MKCFDKYLKLWNWECYSLTVSTLKMDKSYQREPTTRSSWLNCALRADETVYWVSIGHYEAVAVGNWWHWVSRGHLCLYILHKVEIWEGVTNARKTTLEDRATQPMNQDGLDEHLSNLIRQKNSTDIKKWYNYWNIVWSLVTSTMRR